MKENLGRFTFVEELLARMYQKYLISSVKGRFEGCKIVDSANGAAYRVAAGFSKFGSSSSCNKQYTKW